MAFVMAIDMIARRGGHRRCPGDRRCPLRIRPRHHFGYHPGRFDTGPGKRKRGSHWTAV